MFAVALDTFPLLWNLVRPDVAFFGEKDFQQLMIIRRAVTDLCMPIDIVGVPTIPHVRAGRRALIRRVVIDQWLLEQEHGVATSMPQ